MAHYQAAVAARAAADPAACAPADPAAMLRVAAALRAGDVGVAVRVVDRALGVWSTLRKAAGAPRAPAAAAGGATVPAPAEIALRMASALKLRGCLRAVCKEYAPAIAGARRRSAGRRRVR